MAYLYLTGNSTPEWGNFSQEDTVIEIFCPKQLAELNAGWSDLPTRLAYLGFAPLEPCWGMIVSFHLCIFLWSHSFAHILPVSGYAGPMKNFKDQSLSVSFRTVCNPALLLPRLCVRFGASRRLNVLCSSVCPAGAHIPRPTLVWILCQFHVGAHRPRSPLFR